jgi:hypothetical protein
MHPLIFLSGNRPGITRAVRNGDGWHVTPMLPDVDVRCFARDPHNMDVILAGTQGQGIWRSADRGATWQAYALEEQTVKSIAFSSVESGLVFAGMKPPGVWKSLDSGETWVECLGFQAIPSLPDWWSPAEPPGTAYVHAMSVHPTKPQIVLAGIEYGAVLLSEDGGATWTDHRDDAIEDCHTLMFHPSDGRYAYEGGGSGEGGAISTDGGHTWIQPTAGMDHRHYGWAVAADPRDPTTWYVSVSPGPDKAHRTGTAQAAILRSQAGGAWETLTGGLPDPLPNMPYALIPDVGAAGHLYAGLRNGDIWFSANAGETWQQLPVNVGRIEHALLMIAG